MSTAKTRPLASDIIGRRPCGPNCHSDSSTWLEIAMWHEAGECGPVYGHLVLIATHDGHVHVLDLRLSEDESWDDMANDYDEQGRRTREALDQHKAKWWAYLPHSPPINVKATPMGWTKAKKPKPKPRNARDPKREKWLRPRHLSHDYVKPNPQ